MALLRRQAGCSSYFHKVTYLLLLVCLIPFLSFGTPEAWGGTLSSVSPAGASSTVTIYITGTGFNTTASNNEVTFTHTSGVSAVATATAVATLDTATGLRRLTLKVPAGLPAGTTALRVVNKVTGEASIGKSIEIIEISMPDVSSAVPGTANLNVRITGSPNCKFVAGATRATFGAGSGITVNSTTVESATSLMANITVSATAALGFRSAGVITTTQTAFRADVFTISEAVVTNSPPVLTLPGIPSLDEGTSLHVTVSAADPDGNPITLTASVLPGFAGFTDHGNGTGTLTLNPGYTHAGLYNVTFIATDSKGASASAAMNVTVNNVNRAPSLSAISDQNVSEGSSLSFQVSGNDPDGDPLTYIAGGLPEGSFFDITTRTFLWTPGYAQSQPVPYSLTFTVSDGELSDSKTALIAVNDLNRAPVLDTIFTQNINEGETLNFTVSGSDLDGDILAYGAEGLPEGASFDPVTRLFSWTPGFHQSVSSPYGIRFHVSDGKASVEQTVQITVADINRLPQITTTEFLSGRVDQPYGLDILATDDDGDTLIYALLQGPDGMILNASTGRLTWRPLLSHIGDHTVEVNVDDGRGGTASRQYTLSVPDTISPSIILNAPKEAIPGAIFEVTAVAADNDRITSVIIDVNGQDPVELTAPPFRREIMLPSVLSVGSSVILHAKALDTSGNMAEDSVPVTIVGVPDITPPEVTLNAPPVITQGGTVLLTASVSDNTGVSSVSFYVNGELIGTASGSDPVIEYQVPADAVVGTTPVFTVKVDDFSGNSITSEAAPTVTDVPDDTPPQVLLDAPLAVEEGGVLTVTTQASDATGVALVEIYVDHSLVATYTAPPDGGLQITLPPGLEPGTEALIEVTVTDFSGNQTTQSQMVSIEAVKPPARGVLTGEVYNDTTGLPLEGAKVILSGTDGSATVSYTDARGQYTIVANEGTGRVTITRDGFSQVERTGVVLQGNRGSEIFDARLTPIPSSRHPVSSILGGRLPTPFSYVTAGLVPLSGDLAAASGEILVDIPSGALGSDSNLSLYQVSPQGLQGLLPFGWSPIGAVDLIPHGLLFSNPAVITLPNLSGQGQGAGVILAVWDESAGNWKVAALAAVSADGSSFHAEINRSGQFAFLLPDILPQAPPAPSAGDILQGVPPQNIPPDVSAVISPQPRIIFYKPGVHSDVGVNADSPSTAILSGSQIRSKITEEYNFYSGSRIIAEPYTQDIVLYNYNLSGVPGTAAYPVTPSYTFEPLTLEKGIITVEVTTPPEGPADVNVIGPDGGTITTPTGESVTIPPGAVTDFIPVEIVSLTLSGAGLTLPPGFSLAGGVFLSFGGNSLSIPASVSVPLPVSLTGSGQFLLVKPSEVQGATRLILVGVARVENGKALSFYTLHLDRGGEGGGGSVPFEGILSGGRYLLIQTDAGIGFAGGKVYEATGAALASALVSNDTLPIASISMPQGDYVSATATGAFTLTALDTTKMDSGTASGSMPSAGAFVRTDIFLAAEPPRVVSVSPVNGAENIPLSNPVRIQFSEPLDSATVNGNNIFLTGPGGNIPGSISLSSNNTLVTFRPTNPLTSNTYYTLTVNQGVKDLAGYAMTSPYASGFTSLDTVPPLPPPAGNVNATIPGADGRTTVTATQGTAGIRDTVWIVNTTNGTSVPVRVEADGSFTASVAAGITDKIQIKLTDPAGNETFVSLPRFTQTNPDGSLSVAVDAEGGRIEGPGGVVVDVPAGAFPDGAVITIEPVSEADFPVQFAQEQKEVFTFSGGIRLDLGGKTLSAGKYLNLSVPSQGDETIESNPSYGYLGNEDAQWLVSQVVNVEGENRLSSIDTARVIDGRITTSSPPCPGATGNGVYGFFRSREVMGVTYGDANFAPAAVMGAYMLFGGIAAVPLHGAAGFAAFGFHMYEFAQLGAEIAKQALPKRYCLPVLSGRVTLVPNNVKFELYWDELSRLSPPVLQRDIMEVITVNNSMGNAETRFTWADREHISVTEPDVFTVVGVGSDTYTVKLTDKDGAVHPVACFSSGSGGILCRVTPSSVSGIVQVKLDWPNLTQAGMPPGDIRDIDVINVSRSNMVTHFRRQGQTERFSVEGGNGDNYSVKLVDNRGNVTTIACPASGGGGILCRTIASSFVEIMAASGSLSGDTKQIIVKNWTSGKEYPFSHSCPHPGVTCATPDRRMIIEGDTDDVYSLSIVDIDSTGNRTVQSAQVSPVPYPLVAVGNLQVRAAPGTIDPTAAQILEHNSLHGPHHLLPVDSSGQPLKAVTEVRLRGGGLDLPVPLNSILDGAFNYSFNGQMSDNYSVYVIYSDGTTDDVRLPKFQVTVTASTAAQPIRTITGYSPPRGEPLNLGAVSSSSGGPLTLAVSPSLGNVDTSADFALTFSNPVNRGSIQSGFVVQDSSGNIVQGTFRFSEGDTVVTFMPSSPLRMGETYSISLSGVSDVFGSSLAFTTLSLNTFKPRKVASLSHSGSRPLEPIADMDILRTTVIGGTNKTGVVAVTESRDSWKLLTIDVTDPSTPAELGHSGGGRYKKRITLLPRATFSLRPRAPEWFTSPSCGLPAGASQFSGDLAVSTSLNERMSYFSFFNVSNQADPCLIGGKVLTVDPMYLDSYSRPGTLHVTGFARGVAALQHSSGYVAYAAVGEVGLMAADIGRNIPESDPCVTADPDHPPDWCRYPRFQEGLYSGDYADVAVIGAPKPAPALVSISVTPVSAARKPGETQQYRAVGKYSDGSEAVITSAATWVSNDTSVATINNSGLATANASGRTYITASKDGVTSNAVVLKVRELVSIEITPSTASRIPGEIIQYVAEGTYDDGTKEFLPQGSLLWSSSNTGVATINSTGAATAIAGGSTDITASLGAVTSNPAVLEVITLVSISVTPLNSTVYAGGTQQYTAIGTYSNGSMAVLTNSATWHCICSPVAAQVNQAGLATGIAPGTELIWAELAGVISNTVTLTVTTPLPAHMVLINEVVVEPQQDWNDSTGGDGIPFNSVPGSGVIDVSDQWIEITNIGGLVDLNHWTVTFTNSSSISVTRTLGPALLGPGQFMVLINPGNMAADTVITLRDASGMVVDSVDLSAVYAITVQATGVSDEAVVRLSNSSDTNLPADFKRRAATINGPNPAQ